MRNLLREGTAPAAAVCFPLPDRSGFCGHSGIQQSVLLPWPAPPQQHSGPLHTLVQSVAVPSILVDVCFVTDVN